MIEVGEYIRLRGEILRIEIITNKTQNDCYIKFYEYASGNTFNNSEIKEWKHSKNLVDIIETGDFVNGDKVVAVDYTEDEQGNYIDVLGTMEIDDDYAYPIILKNEDIRTIITHEQFEQIKYTVKEN